METAESWDSYKQIVKSAPSFVKKPTDYIVIQAYFGPLLHSPLKEVPDEVYEISRGVEKIVAQSFPSLTVAGIESPHIRYPDDEYIRYVSLVSARQDSALIAYVDMGVGHIAGSKGRESKASPQEAPFRTDCYFPLGTFQVYTKLAITVIWPLIRGIGYATPNPRGCGHEQIQPRTHTSSARRDTSCHRI